MADLSSNDDDKKPLTLRGWWTVLALGITFLSGGLAGQVFNWVVNRPKASVVSYRIVTTTLAAPEAAGLIPNLKVLIGQEPIKALYSHNVELSAQDYIKSAEVGLDFSSAPNIYGFKPEKPSKMHSIACPETEPKLYRCTVGPISGKDPGPYRVTVASDGSDPPKIISTEQGVAFVPAEQQTAEGRDVLDLQILMIMATMMVSSLLFLMIFLWRRR
jgi:hypothetical protein